VLLNPGVLVHDIYEERDIASKRCEEHDAQDVAHLDRGIGAAVGIDSQGIMEKAVLEVHGFHYCVIFSIDYV